MLSDGTKVHHLQNKKLRKLVLNTKLIIRGQKMIVIDERSFEDSPKEKSLNESEKTPEKAFEKEIDK